MITITVVANGTNVIPVSQIAEFTHLKRMPKPRVYDSANIWLNIQFILVVCYDSKYRYNLRDSTFYNSPCPWTSYLVIVLPHLELILN